MTVKNQNKSERIIRDNITRKFNNGEPFTVEERDYYYKKIYTYIDTPEVKHLLGPKIEKALKKIDLPPKYSVESLSEIVEAVKKTYKDFKDGKTSKDRNYWPSDLWQFLEKYRRHIKVRKKEYFFFGWLLIQTAEFKKKNCKKPIKLNWRIACDLMARVTGDMKYLDDYDSTRKRKTIYRNGLRYIRIVRETYQRKIRFDDSLERIKKVEEAYNRNTRHMIRLRHRYGYDKNLMIRIHSFIKQEKKVTQHDLVKRYSNKKLEDIYSCLGFLERWREIFCDMNNKEFYYIGNGKDLEEALPFEVSSFIFPEKFKKLLKDALADAILIK